ncbi:Adenylate kinase isoenzyme 1 [Aphelenchoides besseyi]|nr:Adenylate kinase isoenzyme 1 [Aphelenchoides besseyi]
MGITNCIPGASTDAIERSKRKTAFFNALRDNGVKLEEEPTIDQTFIKDPKFAWSHFKIQHSREDKLDELWRVVTAFYGGRSEVKLEPSRLANVPIFFIVGGPGSGKTTQCEKIVAKYGLTHLSSGDLCREEVKLGSKRGSESTKVMEKGERVPSEIVLDLIKEAMVKAIGKESKGFLIEGYSREMEDAKMFEKEVKPFTSILYIQVSDGKLKNRWKQRGLTSGRVDDKVKSIKKRLQTFNTATQPVVDHYIQKQKLVKIKGEGSVEEIFAQVSEHLQKHWRLNVNESA